MINLTKKGEKTCLIQIVQPCKRKDTTDTSLLVFVRIVVKQSLSASLAGVIWVAEMSAINHGARNAEAIKPNTKNVALLWMSQLGNGWRKMIY